MPRLYIGIDSGTQGTKVLILDADGRRIVSESSAPHELIEKDDGTREQDPEWWTNALGEALAEALASNEVRPADVRAIGVSGQQHGFVPLDARGEVLRRARLWCDTATTAEAVEITRAVGGEEAAIAATGNSIAVGFTASKIAWMRKYEPHLFEKLATVLLPHDYLNFWLTGERKTEFGDASGTGYFDVENRCWAESVIDAIDDSGRLRTCLPEFVRPDHPVGTVRAEIAAHLGLPDNVLVSAGGGDNMMAAIGTGNVAPGVVTASLGTSGTIYGFSDRPVVDQKGELAAFCSSDGHWLPLVCTMNVTVATELMRGLLNLDIADLNAAAESVPPGASGLLLLPYFNGERTPALPDARASLYGMTPSNMTPAHFSRAAIEGATFGLRYGLDVMIRQGIEPKELRLVGGGAKSALWRQIVADVLDCEVVCPQTTEAGALGAALQALWCDLRAGGQTASLQELADAYILIDPRTRTEPQTDARRRYASTYKEYLALDASLRGMYR